MSDAAAASRLRAGTRRPSPVFLALVAVTAAAGWLLWTRTGPVRLSAFVFVLAAWVVSLCLHEFAHALVAFRAGDRSVAERGYLTLDPFRYTHAVYSIVLPLLFVVLGGIGLPGGAVFIDRNALRSRRADSLVSAAGPLTNAILAVVLMFVLVRYGVGDLAHLAFWATLAFLAFLQVTAAVLNALPVPGVDGFGVLEPYLPRPWLARVAPVAPYAVLGLFALLWIPFVNRAFFSAVFALLELFGVPSVYVGAGDTLFRFWLS